jgi:hypothetical protein
MPMSCPNCQASRKDEHHDESVVWTRQKDHQRAVIRAAVTLFLAFMCLIVFGSSYVMAGIDIAAVLFLGLVVRKSFQRKSNVYQCTDCQYIFNS